MAERRRVRNYAAVATRAIAAARRSQALPGQEIAAAIIAELATNTLALDQRLTDLDAQIATMFAAHPQAEIIQSMPGFGPILGATLLVAAGDLRAFPSAGHLAAAAGLVPVPTTRADEPATCTSPIVTADRCATCSTYQRRPA